MPRSRETFPCPNCGADVRAEARACPECGSDDETGWSEETLYDGLDLPGGETGPAPARPRRDLWLRLSALLALAALAALLLLRAR
jgi:hypothetical protein